MVDLKSNTTYGNQELPLPLPKTGLAKSLDQFRPRRLWKFQLRGFLVTYSEKEDEVVFLSFLFLRIMAKQQS